MFFTFRKEALPTRLHYKDNVNISPILILSNDRWMLKLKRHNTTEPIVGDHGYDNIYHDMSTIFGARGPAFKKGVTLRAFENVNIVNLIAHVLGIEAKPNNGTLKVFQPGLKEVDNSGSSFVHCNNVKTIIFVVFISLSIFL